MENTNDEEELIPVEKVLDDMYDDLGIVSWAARDYYYNHYASDEERKDMDSEDKINEVIAKLGIAVIIGLIIVAYIFNL